MNQWLYLSDIYIIYLKKVQLNLNATTNVKNYASVLIFCSVLLRFCCRYLLTVEGKRVHCHAQSALNIRGLIKYF